jgi:hypothetical protein
VLINKFDKSGKIGLSGFDTFQNKNRDGAKLEDLNIQDVLRHGKY